MIQLEKTKFLKTILTLFISVVFLQSLFFKFSNSPETQHIFGILDLWAAGFGFPNLFVAPGIFNAYVIGTAELIASILLLLGLLLKRPLLNVAGAAMSFCIISGAIFFHLFTPLGVEVQDDGGTLFIMACGVWLSAASLIVIQKKIVWNIFFRKDSLHG